MKKQIGLLTFLMVFLLSTVFSFGADQIKKTTYYVSQDKTNFNRINPEKEIAKDDIVYTLKGVNYSISKKITKKANIKGLKEEKVPETKYFTIDGSRVKLYLNQDKTKFKKDQNESTYVYTARDPYTFTPDQTRQFTTEAGDVVTGQLKTTTKGNIYRQTISIPATFTGDAGAKYFYFPNTGRVWPLNTADPTWQGYQRDILSYLNMDSRIYGITGGRWAGASSRGGQYVRNAVFSGTQNVCDYTCVYRSGDGNTDTYTADAEYTGYRVKAVATYEHQMSLLEKLTYVGIGIVVLAACIVLILYWLQRKKKKDEDDTAV